jgi:WD40 repeat protein
LYTDDLKYVFSLEGHTEAVNSLSWKPDSTFLASGSDDKTVHIWNVQARKTVNVYREHSGGVSIVRWSPNGTRIASTNILGPTADFLIFEPLSNTYKYKIPTSYEQPGYDSFLLTIAWSPTSKQIAVSDNSAGVGIWNIEPQKVTLQIAKKYTILDIAWSPDSNKIAVGGGYLTYDGSVAYIGIWNIKTGRSLFELKGHADWILSVGWSPNGKYVATASRDQTIKIWSSLNGRMIKSLVLTNLNPLIWPNYINWSPDSKRIAWTVGEQELCISHIESDVTARCVRLNAFEEF